MPQEQTTALSSNNLQCGIAAGRYHMSVESEVELGFRLCQLLFSAQRLTVHTTEAELYSPLGLQIVREVVTDMPREELRTVGEAGTERPRGGPDLPKVAKTAVIMTIKKDAMQKYLNQLKVPLQRPNKTDKAKNVLRGFLAGIYMSKKYCCDGLDGPDILTDALFDRMQEEGIVTMTTGNLIYYHEEAIQRLQTDPSFLNQLLTERRVSAPQVSLPIQSPQNAPTFETTACPVNDEMLGSIAWQVCEDLAQRERTSLTVGELLDCMYWRLGGAGIGIQDQFIRRVLEIILNFGVFSVSYPDFLANPERYRGYPLVSLSYI